MSLRLLRAFAAVLVAAGFSVVALGAPASAAASCPGGESPCVYLPGGTYTLGNPVSYTDAVGYGTLTVLRHCDSTGTACDETFVRLPGLTVTSTPTTLITLTVPGEGVGLDGTVPVLYVGLPSVSGPGSTALGLTLNVQFATFAVWDTSLNSVKCMTSYVPPNSYVNGTYSACGADLTVTL
jgi:hypothetical protein